jgi:NCS1 family nucleobase:cation symporter-1
VEDLESTQGYIFTWLIGYSALLGPIAGMLIVDYYLVRKTELNVPELYREDGQYSYGKGWNMAALVAFVIGVLPNIPGFLNAAFPASFPTCRKRLKRLYLCMVRRHRHFGRRVWGHDEREGVPAVRAPAHRKETFMKTSSVAAPSSMPTAPSAPMCCATATRLSPWARTWTRRPAPP